ncbi:hypothetical protein, partial [Klebsiella aerogenes]|uniref:hypothetical protein n=1 Tax=Klebsiella aerogenes TaxID=548 RepID=UPI00195493E6
QNIFIPDPLNSTQGSAFEFLWCTYFHETTFAHGEQTSRTIGSNGRFVASRQNDLDPYGTRRRNDAKAARKPW